MFSAIDGLPSHPLLVHVPVVLVPLATIAVVALALRPVWLKHYGVIAVLLSAGGFVGALFAADTGEELEEQLRSAGESITGALHDHVELGDKVQGLAGLFFVLTVVWVVVAWRRRRPGGGEKLARAAMILSVLAVLSGAVATAAVVKTGHTGAESVWERTGP